METSCWQGAGPKCIGDPIIETRVGVKKLNPTFHQTEHLANAIDMLKVCSR